MDEKQWHKASQRQACKVAGISDSDYKYKPSFHKDEPIMAALQSTVERYPMSGL